MKKALFIVSILFVAVITTACINNMAVQELNNKAEEFVAKGDYDSAIYRLQASLDLDATLYQTYYNLGIAQTKAKKYPEAIATFEAGIKVKPDFKDFYYSLATAQLSYYEDLEEFVEDSLKSDDAKKAEVNDAENNIKMTKDEAKKLSEELKKSALENLNKFLAMSPTDADKNEVEGLIKELTEESETNTQNVIED